jgi:hypothetical protein
MPHSVYNQNCIDIQATNRQAVLDSSLSTHMRYNRVFLPRSSLSLDHAENYAEIITKHLLPGEPMYTEATELAVLQGLRIGSTAIMGLYGSDVVPLSDYLSRAASTNPKAVRRNLIKFGRTHPVLYRSIEKKSMEVSSGSYTQEASLFAGLLLCRQVEKSIVHGQSLK